MLIHSISHSLYRISVAAALLAASSVFAIAVRTAPAEFPEDLLRGRVQRAGDRAPVAGARVFWKAGGGAVVTDGRGTFEIPRPGNEDPVLVIERDGFERIERPVRPGEAELLVLLPSLAVAVPGTLDIVVEAAGLGRSAFEMPYAGRSLARERILETDSNGLNETVAAVPGLSFVGGGFHSAPALRGLARNRLILLVDGVRTAAVRTIGGHLGFIHPFAVESVEVVKGPFSTLYGHDAMAGVLQVGTLRPRSAAEGFALSGGGSFRYESAAQSPNGAFFLAGGGPAASFLVSYGRTAEEDYRMGGGTTLPRSGFDLGSLLAKAEIRPAAGHRLDVLYLRTEGRDIGKASGDPALVNVHPSEMNEVAALGYEWRPNGPLFSALEARVSRGLFTLAADFRTVTGSRTVQSLRDLGEDGYGFSLKSTLTPGRGTVLFAGVDGYFQENQRITGTRNVYLAGQAAPLTSAPLDEVPLAATRDIGVFVQGTRSLASRWDLVFGARVDATGERVEDEDGGIRSRSFEPELNGNLGVLYKISSSVRLGANLGTAFRLPTPKDRYFVGQTPAGINIGNPDLRPEHSLNADLVLKVRSASSGPFLIEGSLAAFVNRIRDLIVIQWDQPTGVRTGVFANAGRAEIYGLEADATVAAPRGWTAYAAASVLGAAVHGNDEILDDLPPFEGRLGLRKSFAGGRAWAALRLRGAAAERRTSAGDLPAAAFLVADLSAGRRIGRAWTLRLSVDNVFDASYREFFDLPLVRRKGRSFNLSLTAGF